MPGKPTNLHKTETPSTRLELLCETVKQAAEHSVYHKPGDRIIVMVDDGAGQAASLHDDGYKDAKEVVDMILMHVHAIVTMAGGTVNVEIAE